MAPSLFASGTYLAGNNRSSMVLDAPDSVVSGMLVYALIYVEGGPTITPPGDDETWQLLDGMPIISATFRVYVYWKRLDDSDGASYTFGMGTTVYCSGGTVAIADPIGSGDPHDFIDFDFRDTSGANTPAVSDTTSVDDVFLLWMGADFNGDSWTTAPSGMSFARAYSNEGAIAGKLQTTAGATGSLTATNSSAAAQAAILIGILPISDDPDTQNIDATSFTVPVTFDVPTLAKTKQYINATGFDVPVTFGVPTMMWDLDIPVTSFTVPVTFGSPVIGQPEGVAILPDVFGDTARLKVEIAWGADIVNDIVDDWIWTDVTTNVRIDPPISVTIGQNDESPIPNPASVAFQLSNASGLYYIDGRSPLWPYVRRNTPIRVSIQPNASSEFLTLFLGYADGFSPISDLSMNEELEIVQVSGSGILRRINQGFNDLISPYRRSMVDTESVIAYWPCEDGKNSRQLENVRGGSPGILINAPKPGTIDEFDSSYPIVDTAKGSLSFFVDSGYSFSGENQIRWLMSIPEDGLDDGTVLMHITFNSSSLYRLDLAYETGVSAFIAWYAYEQNGTFISSGDMGFEMDGTNRRWSIELRQNGTAVDMSFAALGVDDTSAGYINASLSTRTLGRITQIEFTPYSNAGGVGIGHVTVQNDITGFFESVGPLRAFRNEITFHRFNRICNEYGIVNTTFGDGTPFTDQDRMSAQIRGSLAEILESIAVTDAGVIHDGLNAGLTFATRRQFERSWTAGSTAISRTQAVEPLELVDDDSLTINSSTVNNHNQSSATITDDDSIADIGLFDKATDVYYDFDEYNLHRASWELHKGTMVQGKYRIPTIRINFRETPELAISLLQVTPGARINHDGERLTLVGYRHLIHPAEWVMELLCVPYVHNTAILDGNNTFDARIETDGCAVDGTHFAGDTTILVTTAWTTDPADYPFNVTIGGLVYAATAFSGFTMTISPGLVNDVPDGYSVSLWDSQAVWGL